MSEADISLTSPSPNPSTKVIHVAHYADGYPLCWTYAEIQSTNDIYEATEDEEKVTCVDCIQITNEKV